MTRYAYAGTFRYTDAIFDTSNKFVMSNKLLKHMSEFCCQHMTSWHDVMTLTWRHDVRMTLEAINPSRSKEFFNLVRPRGINYPPPSRWSWGLEIQRSYSQNCEMQAEVRNPRWRVTDRHAYISASTQRSCMIPTAKSMFSRSKNSMKLFFYIVWCKWKPEIQDGRPTNRKYLYLILYTA